LWPKAPLTVLHVGDKNQPSFISPVSEYKSGKSHSQAAALPDGSGSAELLNHRFVSAATIPLVGPQSVMLPRRVNVKPVGASAMEGKQIKVAG